MEKEKIKSCAICGKKLNKKEMSNPFVHVYGKEWAKKIIMHECRKCWIRQETAQTLDEVYMVVMTGNYY